MGSQAITQENPTQGPRVLSVLPQTQQVLTESLQTSSHQHIPQKELSQAMQALQEVAGEGKIPTKTQVAVTSWMLGKGIEVTPNTLQSLLQFHSGHQEVQGLYKDLQQLQTYLKGENPELAKLAQSGIAELQGKDGESIKDTLSFYQKGNGSQLNKWLNQVRAHLSQMPQPKVEWMQLAQSLQGRLTVQEDFLAGLKQYNIQAQRQDTPQLYEVPISFGEETQHALLKVFKRDQGQGSDAKKNYKVVIELDLEGLGKVRSEVSLIDQHLQLDFLSPNSESLTALKASAGTLQDRLSDHQLKANLGFKQKDVQDNLLITEQASHAAPKESSGINITA
jgi:hypothetical protein